MYPQSELNGLAARKRVLLQHIALRRIVCDEAAVQAARPLVWLDRMMNYWRGLTPLAKIAAGPATFIALKTMAPRWKSVRTLLRWLPLSLTAFGSLRR